MLRFERPGADGSLLSFFRAFAALAGALALAACATPGGPPGPGAPSQTGARPHYKVGQPYQVGGRWFYPKEDPYYDAIGVASWYGDEFHGKLTANGEIFDKNRLSAAHTTLPMPSIVEVTNLENGRRVVIRLNDRGPFVGDRVIDLSHATAKALDFEKQGLARVRVRYLGRAELTELAPLPGSGAQPRYATREPATPSLPPARIAARRTTAPTPAAAPAADDPIARLLAGAGMTAAPSSAAAASPVREMWIEVARFLDLNELETARVSMRGFGGARVVPGEADTREPGYLLQIGPFFDAESAETRLAALREAGYSRARLAGR